MQDRLISKSEWARHAGISPSYVTKLLREGKIYEVRGRIDPIDADRRLAAITPAVRTGKPPKEPYHYKPDLGKSPRRVVVERQDEFVDEDEDEEEDSTDSLREDELPRSRLPDALLRARIKTEREKGMHAELERKRKQGELVDAEEVRSASTTRAVAEREALLAWPRRVSADMAVELGTEERLLLQVLQKYIRDFLAERSKQPTRVVPQMELSA